jgi:hypothetical protein
VDGQPDLLEVVATTHPVGGLAHLLDRGQQQADEHRDDRDHNQQFDEGERRPPMWKRSAGASHD